MTSRSDPHDSAADSRLFHFSQRLLGGLEKGFLSRAYKSQQPQLFILGLPRSGTTLVYQYIVHRLRVSYFTNYAGRYYRSPCMMTFLQRRELEGYVSDYKSRYGKVSGRLAPREGGAIWGRFFGLEDYVTFAEMKPKTVRELQTTIACIQETFDDLPFVNKNVKHMLRIDALSKAFPNALFLVVQRDMPQVALSVLRGRYANLVDPSKWWSVKPPDYPALKDLSIVDQVAHQLWSLQDRMDSDLAQLPSERVLSLNYEDFCSTPEVIIRQLRARLGEPGYRNGAADYFRPSNNEAQSAEEESLLYLVAQLRAM